MSQSGANTELGLVPELQRGNKHRDYEWVEGDEELSAKIVVSRMANLKIIDTTISIFMKSREAKVTISSRRGDYCFIGIDRNKAIDFANRLLDLCIEARKA